MKKIKLTEAEKNIMEILWLKESAFMKDILESHPEPQPAASTVATLLKRMQDKNLVHYKTFGNSREYHPSISKEAYFQQEMSGIIGRFFDNSIPQFASFFTANAKLSQEELKELRKIIDNQIDK